jgi:hypothetical protein
VTCDVLNLVTIHTVLGYDTSEDEAVCTFES